MLIRVCDRCGTVVDEAPLSTPVQVPLESPATKPKAVTGPFAVTCGLELFADVTDRGLDLCAACRVSAILELLGVSLTAAQLGDKGSRILFARLATIVGAIAAAAPAPAPAPVAAPAPIPDGGGV